MCAAFALALCASQASASPVNSSFGIHPVQDELHGRELEPGLYQLTGNHLKVGQTDQSITELPDPAPPYVNSAGQVEIYGSAFYFIRYANWQAFAQGGSYEMIPLDLRYPNGVPYQSPYTQPWDLRKFRLESPGASPFEFLVGGSMSPTAGHSEAVWPQDNITRRIFDFRPNSSGSWVRDQNPIVGQAGENWLGHSYGGNLFQPSSPALGVLQAGAGLSGSSDPLQQIYFFYEKVSSEYFDQQSGEGPLRTELFIQKVNPATLAGDGHEVLALGIHDPPYPSTARTIGGYLMEGPRPIRMTIEGQVFYVIAFSSNDYPTDSYTINYAWSRSVEGPYTPALTDDGKDLLDLGLGMKARYGLSWLGRPAIFPNPDGSTYSVLFHGVSKSILPDNDYSHWPTKYQLWQFFRSIFLDQLDVSLDTHGAPKLRLHLN